MSIRVAQRPWQPPPKTSGTAADKKLQAWAQDRPIRWFDSESEATDYAAGKSEHLGLVRPKNGHGGARGDGVWVRLPKNGLLVLGENHTNETTATVAAAVGTTKVRYEGFTAAPAARDDTLAKALAGRHKELAGWFKDSGGDRAFDASKRIGTAAGNHAAEDLGPKAVRGFAEVREETPVAGRDQRPRIVVKAAEFNAVRFGVLDAARRKLAAYTAHKALWDELADALAKAAKPGANEKQVELPGLTGADVAALRQEYETAARAELEATYGKQAYDAFRAAWAPNAARVRTTGVLGDYDTGLHGPSRAARQPLMDAERDRDFSMLQHILKAQKEGTRLFGLGELHQKRLSEMLDAMRIPNMDEVTFFEEQRHAHPQDPDVPPRAPQRPADAQDAVPTRAEAQADVPPGPPEQPVPADGGSAPG